jgi:ubiquinone/menaquinone biosynthesis C-methylase UbiE
MNTDDSTMQMIQEAGWVFPESVWRCLSDYEKTFVIDVFTGKRSFNYYTKRLKALGFTNMERVLDAACGMGQWTQALSSLNSYVDGVDINIGRLLVARSLADSLKKTNCSFRYSFLEALPFEPESFDGIFCYGAFMFTHVPTTLSEFFRVLKPGGRVYLNANSSGWYAHLLIDRGIKKREFSMIKTVLRTIVRTITGRQKNIVVRRGWLKKQIELTGMQVLTIGLEGEISFVKDIKTEPAYTQRFYGMPTIIEVLAQKSDA